MTFEVELLKVIDETIAFVLGNVNLQIIYCYLERKGCPKHEIPNKLDLFVDTLDNLVGRDRGQMLGSASILESVIIKELCKKLGVKYDEVGPGYFPEQCCRLKQIFIRMSNAPELTF